MNVDGNREKLLGLLFALIFGLGFTGCSKPELPVAVSFRNAVLDKSLVAQFHNNSDTTMKVVVEMSSRTTDQSKKAELVIGGKAMTEVGWAEGWRFVSGESIRIHHSDYRDVKIKVP